MPDLTQTPDARSPLIVVGTSVRKPAAVLQYFLTSLAAQELPARARLHFCFVADSMEPDAEALLRDWTKERGGEVLRGVPGGLGDFADTPNFDSHQWSLAAMRRVGLNKNKILARARELRADAVWLADADLVMDTTTLASMWHADRDVTCAVYWTYWTKRGFETQQTHAAPQVWLRHPYDLNGRGMDEGELRGRLVSKDLTQVWGQGACTLLSRRFLESGIDFSPAPDFPQEGLMAGEDRQFCIKAERAHIPMWADPWPDIFHIYHLDADLPQAPAMQRRLHAPHPKRATLGDAVSLRLTALEPLRTPRGLERIATQFVRGRLGQLPLLPELEEAILRLDRGDKAVIPVHIPMHFPLAGLRGQRRLIDVHLVDCKPWGYPPTLERELYVNSAGSAIDHSDLTDAQHHGILQLAGVS